MYQQNQFQGNQAFNQTNANRYQPAGFVQSHYQGQLSRNAASGPVTAHAGYQASQQQNFNQSSFSQGAMTGGMQAQASAQRNPVLSATNARQQEGPVIQQLGYQAGQSWQNQQQNQQQSFQPQSYQSQSSFRPAQGAMNASFGQASQPVISHVGYQAGQEARGPVNQIFQNQGQQSFQSAGAGYQQSGIQAHASTQQNPVYNATNARQQEGPVIQQLGYQAGAQQNAQLGQSAGMNAGFQNRF